MKVSCLSVCLLVSVINFVPRYNALEGPSLLDDLLVPYEFHRPNHIRRVRSLQNPRYNTTYEIFAANVTEQILPISTTRYFVSDVADPIYFYNKVKAYGHFTSVTNPVRSFSVLEPSTTGGCAANITATVEASARQRNCYVAQNGGFFDTKSGSCLGNIISDGREVQSFDEIQNANFGITKNGTIVVGYLSSDEIRNLEFKQLIGGAIWLVRNGEPYVEDSFKCESAAIQETGSLRTFIDVKSARTAIGHDSSGRVLLVNVEGQTRSRGVNLNQFAKLLIDEFHLVNAINLDGGGSATLILNNTLASYPSDHCTEDPEWRCARAVAAIVCVHDLDCDEECIHGDCVHGSCVCHNNYQGSGCAELFCHHHNCSRHGKCTPDGCLCSSGWHGKDCTAPCGPKFFGANCSQHCQCQNNASCDSVTGGCSCLPGFAGAVCDKACPVGRYGRNCENFCHCEETCNCDATTGICSNTSIQYKDYDATVEVLQCITRMNEKKKVDEQSDADFTSFHWMAVFCTTVGVLALSLVTNVYLLITRSNDVTIGHCCDTKQTDGYLPLHSNEMSSPRRDRQNNNDETMQQPETDDVTIQNDDSAKSSWPNTRPYSMEDHRKVRGKRKSPKWFHRSNNDYHKLPSREVQYEETALLSES